MGEENTSRDTVIHGQQLAKLCNCVPYCASRLRSLHSGAKEHGRLRGIHKVLCHAHNYDLGGYCDVT